ncbi:MAG: sigma-54 dependent transcriptional regulator [Myxococcota bacterium]
MTQVMVVDDDERTRRVLQILIEGMGLEASPCGSAEAALERLRRESAALVLTDLKMPGMDGLAFMRALRAIDDELPVIVLTAYGSVEAAVEAMKLGAVDFVPKPFDIDAVEVLVRQALAGVRHRTESRYLREQSGSARGIEGIIGRSQAMQDVFHLVRKVAPTRSAVLITGETGTGKELVARAIHAQSPRKDELFVALNCSAIPGDLLESELFGHVKGAFSGAHQDRVGRFKAADRGTLFLDEIGDMDLRLQAKLLRVLQEGIVEPVGGNRGIKVDVRVVSSTNRPLEAAIEASTFRSDLFYRLNVFRIELPALRDRREDIPALARAFLAELARDLGRGRLELSAGAERVLSAYPWPGNVRELRNIMERSAVLSEGCEVDEGLVASQLGRPDGEPEAFAENLLLARAVAEAEQRAIREALAMADDNKIKAAGLLGIGERTLWTKLKKYGL